MFGFFSFIPAQNSYASHFYERVYRTFSKKGRNVSKTMLSFPATFFSLTNSSGSCCSLKVSSSINWFCAKRLPLILVEWTFLFKQKITFCYSAPKDCLWCLWKEPFYWTKILLFVLQIFTGFSFFKYCSFFSVIFMSFMIPTEHIC